MVQKKSVIFLFHFYSYDWNLDSNREWDSVFPCTGFLILRHSISGFRIPQAKFLRFRNLDSQPYMEHGSQSCL